MRCHGEVERLDGALASFARTEAALRLRLGQVLEVLGRGKHFDLGFSSIAAYALERCDRSVRWAEAARCVARRLEVLPELRRAMAFGSVSWSMGELLARVAQPQDETRWIEAAESRTVREMMRLVDATCDERATSGAVSNGPAAGWAVFDGRAAGVGVLGEQAAGVGVLGEQAAGVGVLGEQAAARTALTGENGETGESEEMCTLTFTVDHEEAWLFEATRALLEQLGEHGGDAHVEALLAEGQGTLLAALPAGALDLDRLEAVDTAQQGWLRELSRWRAEAEARCEENFRVSVVGSGAIVDLQEADPVRASVANAAALGFSALESAGCHDLDRMLRGLSRLLARHELELSRLVLQFHRADGWRRLGYASEAQYARERLGMSRSSLVARRALALRLEKLPRVAEALAAGRIGVEAAGQVVRVATPSTQAAWVERAGQRTIKHLREEVAAALIAVRLSGQADCPPPVDEEMAAFHELEQAVVSGRVCQPRPANDLGVARGAGTHATPPLEGARSMKPAAVEVKGVGVTGLTEPASEQRRAWLVMLGSLARWLESGVQLSAGAGKAIGPRGITSAGRIALRLRVSRANYAWWRGLEAQARRWLPSGMSWLRFLCLSIWSAWRQLLGTDVAYGQIYIRDRFRCSSPVCSRRDVTPHHLQFRSAGGSDEVKNVTSVCTWCHLFGVHGGRIRAVGTAERIRWELGAAWRPCLIIDGRERVAA
jgi:hypothetical protein